MYPVLIYLALTGRLLTATLSPTSVDRRQCQLVSTGISFVTVTVVSCRPLFHVSVSGSVSVIFNTYSLLHAFVSDKRFTNILFGPNLSCNEVKFSYHKCVPFAWIPHDFNLLYFYQATATSQLGSNVPNNKQPVCPWIREIVTFSTHREREVGGSVDVFWPHPICHTRLSCRSLLLTVTFMQVSKRQIPVMFHNSDWQRNVFCYSLPS